MERESFEDGATARYLNDRFIPIKVDREERPEIDQIYMAAVQAMTGQGGWPMSGRPGASEVESLPSRSRIVSGSG